MRWHDPLSRDGRCVDSGKSFSERLVRERAAAFAVSAIDSASLGGIDRHVPPPASDSMRCAVEPALTRPGPVDTAPAVPPSLLDTSMPAAAASPEALHLRLTPCPL